MKLSSVARTDVGRRRQINEDALFRDDARGFYVIADGVGGHNKGEIASREAVEQLRMWVYGAERDLDRLVARIESGDKDGVWDIRRLLESGVKSACYMVYGMAELDPEKKGMSTTLSALLIRANLAFAVHVGDSRVYRVRGSAVLQMTEDHTLINYKVKHGMMTRAEAEKASGKNVITRAVGHKDYVQVDTVDIDVAAGDRFLLCSDGLHGYFTERRRGRRAVQRRLARGVRRGGDRPGQPARRQGQHHRGRDRGAKPGIAARYLAVAGPGMTRRSRIWSSVVVLAIAIAAGWGVARLRGRGAGTGSPGEPAGASLRGCPAGRSGRERARRRARPPRPAERGGRPRRRRDHRPRDRLQRAAAGRQHRRRVPRPGG